MFVLAKRYESNRKALILFISPLKSIRFFERPAVGDGITAILLWFSNLVVLFADTNLKC